MVYCEKCGTKIPEDASFCEGCGAKTPYAEERELKKKSKRSFRVILGLVSLALIIASAFLMSYNQLSILDMPLFSFIGFALAFVIILWLFISIIIQKITVKVKISPTTKLTYIVIIFSIGVLAYLFLIFNPFYDFHYLISFLVSLIIIVIGLCMLYYRIK